jgi:hypothetical protein
MKKKNTVILAIVFLSACSGARYTPPPDINNACVIKADRPDWFRDLDKAEDKWGVPVPVFLAAIYQESKFVARARTPFAYKMGVIPWGRQSSALGYAQAIDSTWDWYREDTGRRSAKRDRFRDAVDFMGWYMNETFERNGVAKTDAYNQYLAYHEGQTGFAKGSYKRKKWLTPIARSVEARALMYQAQLQTCV